MRALTGSWQSWTGVMPVCLTELAAKSLASKRTQEQGQMNMGKMDKNAKPRPDLPMNEEFVKLLRRILKARSIVNPVHEMDLRKMDLRKALDDAERQGSIARGYVRFLHLG